MRRRVAALAAVAAVAVGCGPYDVTAPRLDAAVGQTFANLYADQQRLLATGAVARDVQAVCTRAGSSQVGAGDGWSCTVTYVPPDGRLQSVTYDLSVQADGCFHAEGPPGVVGQMTEQDAARRTVVNPLFAFDGCFDTS